MLSLFAFGLLVHCLLLGIILGLTNTYPSGKAIGGIFIYFFLFYMVAGGLLHVLPLF